MNIPRTALARALAVALALGAAFASGASAQVSDDTIRIGFISDMSGLYRDYDGPAGAEAIRMAIADMGGAIDGLGLALPRLVEIGGSHAQRDLFEQVYLDALVRHGSERTLSAAQGVLQQQVNGQPESVRLKRQLARVYAGLHLPLVG